MTEERLIDLGFKKVANGKYVLEIRLPFDGKREIIAWHGPKGWFFNYWVNNVIASNNADSEAELDILVMGISGKRLQTFNG